jgi:hypothetical protein
MAPSGQIADIEGGGASVVRTSTVGSVDGQLRVNGRSYEILEEKPAAFSGPGVADINARHVPLEQLLTASCSTSASCLQFTGSDATSVCPYDQPGAVNNNACPPDREELLLSGQDTGNQLQVGQTNYLRFAIDVAPSTATTKRLIISQVWQDGSTATATRGALGPAFAVMMSSTGTDDARVDFTYRNDPAPANNQATTFASVIVPKGQWHLFDLMLQPAAAGTNGSILVWEDHQGCTYDPTTAVNDSATDTSTSSFAWGYPTESVAGGLQNTFETRVGMYRGLQSMQFVQFTMDEIRLGSTSSAIGGCSS